MLKKLPTYDIATGYMSDFVRKISIGMPAPLFESRDETGRILSLSEDSLSGNYLVLIFINKTDNESAREFLASFAQYRNQLNETGANIVVISENSDASANIKLKQDSKFSWPILSDAGGSLFASFGLHKGENQFLRIVLVTPLRQIRAWYDDPKDIKSTIGTIMNQITPVQLEENKKWVPFHAPILVIPNVLTRDDCMKLIEAFESKGQFQVSMPTGEGLKSDYKMPVYEHNRQDRVDHIIKDREMLGFLDQRINERINPEIKKAFSFAVTRREELHIARYVGPRGGNKMGHRDNTGPATAYRRFALSINLNDDYEGGELLFKEYSEFGYKGPAGTALIFSSSLLHEVQETTEGTRYNLISHLFDNSSAPIKR
ncbi:MAG: redoxin domain-containing protein [Enterobacterales bacterium]|nr:redoxin domain-containing protein [Enterobacterales bacterium]